MGMTVKVFNLRNNYRVGFNAIFTKDFSLSMLMLYKTNAYIVPNSNKDADVKLGHLNNSTSALVLQASQLLIELGRSNWNAKHNGCKPKNFHVYN
jgi:hypothetical protein